MPRRRVDVAGYDRDNRGRPEHVRDYSQERHMRSEDERPAMSALRRSSAIPVEPHGAFEVGLVDDAGSVANNIYEIREVGTRKKLAMTGEEILNLPRTLKEAP